MPDVPVRESLPEVKLVDQAGRAVALRDLKRLKQAAIFLFHGKDCAACMQRLQEFAGAAHRYAEIPAAVIAAPLEEDVDLAGLASDLGLKFILARDAEGKLAERFAPLDPGTGRRTACCVVADAWGEVYTVLRGEDEVIQSEILNWMDFIDVQCPE